MNLFLLFIDSDMFHHLRGTKIFFFFRYQIFTMHVLTPTGQTVQLTSVRLGKPRLLAAPSKGAYCPASK